MSLGPSTVLRSSLVSTTLNIHLPQSCSTVGQTSIFGRNRQVSGLPRSTGGFCGAVGRQKRASCGRSSRRLHFAQRSKPIDFSYAGGAHSVGAAGAFVEAPIETIDAVDTDALLLPAAHLSAPLDNTELQRRKLDVINSMKALNEMEEAETKFTAEDKEKMRKATVDMRLAKRKAKADHRRAQSDRQLSHSAASTSSSAAELLPSSPQPLKHGSTAATASGSSKHSVKSKATKAALATTVPSSAPVEGLRSRAQRRATTRSGRNAAWGMEAVAEASNEGRHVVDARLGNVARAEAGLGTAVGGLFKVSSHLLTAAQECELTIHVKELLRCEKVREDAIKDLGRQISDEEWAAACGTSSLETFTETMLLGKAAKKQMIQCNQRLVMSVARKYQGRGMDISDLVAEGIVGLIKGVERFDHTRGFKFSTYAHWWIRQAVNRAICEQGRVVRLPVHLHEIMMKVRKAEKELANDLRREPTKQEVANKAGISEAKLHGLHKMHRNPSALEAPAGKDSTDQTVADMIEDETEISPDEAATQQLLNKDMENLLYTLSARESAVLKLRYGLDDGREKTLEEVGRILLVTRERIRQIEFKALRKLKEPQRCSVLKSYADPAQPEAGRRGRSMGLSGKRG